ncbi:Preprotein translocase, SecG subunit [Bombilactobacillus mellifer]|uniref:Protein-export membrane protein SecG n=1 Tax=Bombilactobacillus mellifer TaxID=1218492 RepID=A0A0F4LWV3_9LACO|nr:Preprotein translocase, SecG subunit [Bombilactobacillus mellifer]
MVEALHVYNLLMNILIIDSILIVIAVMMQPQKQQDALNALSGGAGDLFNTQKKRGFEAFMERVTAVLAVIFFVCAVALAFLSSK